MTEEDTKAEAAWALQCKDLGCGILSICVVTEKFPTVPNFCPFCGKIPDRISVPANLLLGME